MFARGQFVLGGVLLLVFLAIVPIAIYISNRDSTSATFDGNEKAKLVYISGLLKLSQQKIPDCPSPFLVGNGECNQELNIPECNFDGNDCPTTVTTTTSTSTWFETLCIYSQDFRKASLF